MTRLPRPPKNPPPYTPPPARRDGSEYDEPAEADAVTLWLLAVVAAAAVAVALVRTFR